MNAKNEKGDIPIDYNNDNKRIIGMTLCQKSQQQRRNE